MDCQDYQDYYEDLAENSPHEVCPKCGRWYGDIEFDYQFCYKCGWDVEEEKYNKPIEPTQSDYEMGDADILTGQWL